MAAIVETTVPRTGELSEVEESFAMNVYKFWTSCCKTDKVFEEDPMSWDELPDTVRENFVSAMRTQVLMPIQTYINQIAKDRDLATNLLAKKVQQAPNRDNGVAGSGFCYVCSRNPATNGRLCVACHRSIKKP